MQMSNNAVMPRWPQTEQVSDIKSTLSQLEALGLIENKHHQAFLSKLRGVRRFKSVVVKSRLDEHEVALFSVNRYKFPVVRLRLSDYLAGISPIRLSDSKMRVRLIRWSDFVLRLPTID